MNTTNLTNPDEVREYVRERYNGIAVQNEEDCGCAPTCCAPGRTNAPPAEARPILCGEAPGSELDDLKVREFVVSATTTASKP